MENDVIAYLYPYNDYHEIASEAIKANSRHAPPLLQDSGDRQSRGERESTEPPENLDPSPLDYLPSIAVRNRDVPRTKKGLVFGSNPNCDVFLDIQGVSNVHFALTFDRFNRPIIKDLNSFIGTQVTYNGEGEGVRRDFCWIIGGHPTPQEKEDIVITVPDIVSFQVVVRPFDRESPDYIDGIERFGQGTATIEGLLDDLGLSLPPTRPRTRAHAPGTGEIYLTKELGEGSFGVVTYLWNVSTSEERAVKAPTLKAVKSGRVDVDAWKREAGIMKKISHPNIVELIQSSFSPYPRLDLEYVPGGALDDHSDISYSETLEILTQCLSALAYLHGQEPPIAHRDIKPANMLVEYRYSGCISVKLGDFGLSRDRVELTTLCGTQMYLAPEIYSESHRYKENRLGYTRAVDIWSLGVVACELTCGLPTYQDRYRTNGFAWCEKIVERLQKILQTSPSELGRFLLKAMVVLDPGDRSCADDCFDVVVALDDIFSHASSPPAPKSDGQDQATSRYALQSYNTEDLSTVVYQPRSAVVDTSSYLGRSGPPLPASPSSPRMTQHNEESEEASSSSAIGSQQGHELTHFLDDYSENPLNPCYVGSFLASQLGENSADDWSSQFLNDSSQQNQISAAGQWGPSGSNIPKGGSGGRHTTSGIRAHEGGNGITDADEDEERRAAELLLQAIGPNFRPSYTHGHH